MTRRNKRKKDNALLLVPPLPISYAKPLRTIAVPSVLLGALIKCKLGIIVTRAGLSIVKAYVSHVEMSAIRATRSLSESKSLRT